MIPALTPLADVIIADVFLMKIAEQGLGIPARQRLLDQQNYLPELQKRVDDILCVRNSLDPAHVARLSRIKTIVTMKGGYPKVNKPTAEALLEMLLFQDQTLSLLAGAGLLVAGFVPFTTELKSWFLELHRLEARGILEGIEEHPGGQHVSPGFPESAPHRRFVINTDKLRALGANMVHNIIVTAASVTTDNDAEVLHQQLSAL